MEKSVSSDFKDDWDTPFAELAESVYEIVSDPDYQLPEPPPPAWEAPEKIEIQRLPVTGAELFGRQDELELLDEGWEDDELNVVSLVAYGGVGKSTLVNKWLERLSEDNYRGAKYVYGWSFYSQGTGERVTSADQFIAHALEWFGDPDPNEGSPWDKGQRLAELIRKEKSLLVLDGMEPLQSGTEFEKGKIKDPALATLLTELAKDNPGLCVITTRETVPDLAHYPDSTQERNLELISAEAGRALLRVGGVQGSDAELENTARDFGLHALALNLLASYLKEIPGHNISEALKIPDLDIPEENGKYPRRVMAAFAERFGEGSEPEVLNLLGLFDRPAEGAAITILREAPAIPDLTDHIQALPEADWLKLLAKLRDLKLIAKESTHRPDSLDCHPLLREHFGNKLKEESPAAWREAHSRLYEYYKNSAKELPDTLEEMAPLYAAVAHGCLADRHLEALVDVFYKRIFRRNEFYSADKLGAFGTNLASLSNFFDMLWHYPNAGLTEKMKGWILNESGFHLRALSRLTEAAQPMQAGLESAIAQKEWKEAAARAANMSELYLTSGDVPGALEYARQSMELADQGEDAFLRMTSRTSLANALHQEGQVDEAEALFREAEEMQKEDQPKFSLLYSQRGYQYCDLLLSQGEFSEVLRRAKYALDIVLQGSRNLLDIALNNLSLGRAHLMQAEAAKKPDYKQAADRLEAALTGLRRSGNQDEIPRGLLARAELRRTMKEYEKAGGDLDEAYTIATRGGMRLHEADCHLEYARLYLAMDEKEKAREHWKKAKDMVNELGYHRRNEDVKELEKTLK